MFKLTNKCLEYHITSVMHYLLSITGSCLCGSSHFPSHLFPNMDMWCVCVCVCVAVCVYECPSYLSAHKEQEHICVCVSEHMSVLPVCL